MTDEKPGSEIDPYAGWPTEWRMWRDESGLLRCDGDPMTLLTVQPLTPGT